MRESPDLPLPARGIRAGFDVGGTYIDAVLVDPDDRLIGALSVARRGETPADLVAQLTVELLPALCHDAGVAAVSSAGIGLPGVVDLFRGQVLESWNVPAVMDPEFLPLLGSAMGVPIRLENDVNVAALGEATCGAGRGLTSIVTLNIGTGIRCGFVLGGHLVRGCHGAAGEIAGLPIGFVSYETARRDPRILERALSGKAVSREAARLRGSPSETGETGQPGDLFGDPTSPELEVVRSATVRRAAMVIACLQAVLDPEALILTGGLGTHDPFVAAVTESAAALDHFGRFSIRRGMLGRYAGAIGAALLHELVQPPRTEPGQDQVRTPRGHAKRAHRNVIGDDRIGSQLVYEAS